MAKQNEVPLGDPVEELWRQQTEIEEAAREQAATLQKEREALIDARRPAYALQDRRNLLAETIDRVKAERPRIVEQIAELDRLAERVFTSQTGQMNLFHLLGNRPDLATADLTLHHMDRFLLQKESELATIESELRELANKHRFPGLLKWVTGR